MISAFSLRTRRSSARGARQVSVVGEERVAGTERVVLLGLWVKRQVREAVRRVSVGALVRAILRGVGMSDATLLGLTACVCGGGGGEVWRGRVGG